MKELKITLANESHNLSYSSGWNSLEADQLICLARLLKRQTTVNEVKLKMLLYCIGGTVKTSRRTMDGSSLYNLEFGGRSLWLTAEELNACASCFDYLFAEVDGKQELNPELYMNPFKSTKCGCITVYGPDDALANMSYQEFANSQIWFSRAHESEDMLNQFVSSLYRRRTKPSSPELIAKMSPSVKTIIVWFYIGSLQFLQKKFPKVFQGTGSGSVDVVGGQMRIIDALAKHDLSKLGSVKEAPLHNALYNMQIAAEEFERMEKEMNKK